MVGLGQQRENIYFWSAFSSTNALAGNTAGWSMNGVFDVTTSAALGAISNINVTLQVYAPAG